MTPSDAAQLITRCAVRMMFCPMIGWSECWIPCCADRLVGSDSKHATRPHVPIPSFKVPSDVALFRFFWRSCVRLARLRGTHSILNELSATVRAHLLLDATH